MVKPWQLESEYELPYRDDDAAAVYFVFDFCELIYIGSSKQICTRLCYWWRDRRYGRKRWSHIGVMLVPEDMRFTIEAYYIKRFWPRLNNECA